MKPNRIFLSIFFVMGISSISHAGASYGQASDIFGIGAGARAMGMGGAFTGLSDDASAPYFNPAGLALLDEHQIMGMHAPLFSNTNYDYLASVHPLGDRLGAVGFADALLMSDKFTTRNINNQVTDSNASLRNNALFVSYAHILPFNLSAGANMKFIQQHIAGYSGSDVGLDLGFLWRRSPLLSVGIAFANLNSPEVTLDTHPDVFRPLTRVGVASNVFKEKVTLTADMTKVSQQGALVAGGIEFSPTKLFQLRGGYNANKSYTFGVGLRFKTIRIDYAFSDTDVSAFNKVSFTWAWHNIYKTDMEPPMKEGQAIYPLSGFKNEVAFKTSVPNQVVSRWSLVIKNADGKMVRTLGADLRPPEVVTWDARNTVGEPVVDGMYTYEFTVDYKNGKTWRVMRSLTLALPDHKSTEDSNMNLQLNGSQSSEEGTK